MGDTSNMGLVESIESTRALTVVEKKAVVDACRFQELDSRIRELQARTQEIKNRGYWMRQFSNTTRDLAELQEESLKIGQEFHQLLQASIAFGVKNNLYVRQLSEALVNLEEEQRGTSGEYMAAAKELLAGLANTEEDLLAKITHLASEAATTKAHLCNLTSRTEALTCGLTDVGHAAEMLASRFEAQQQMTSNALQSLRKTTYVLWAACGLLTVGLIASLFLK